MDFASAHPGPMILPRPPDHGWQPPHQQQIHNRSCTECCRRKVRCDRYHPCSNCVKARSECIFPKSRRTPARRKKATRNRHEELMNSLRRLERRLQSTEAAELAHDNATNDGGSEEHANLGEETRSKPSSTSGPSPSTAFFDEITIKRDESARLVLDHDRSRYISNNFWASMSREIEEMRDILDGSSSELDDEQDVEREQESATPSSRLSQSSRDLFLFSPIATSRDLQSLYPSSSDLLTIFDVFQENVDPVVRIFHRPTLRATVMEALSLPNGSLDRHTEVIVFSISYAALTSLNEMDCQELFKEERRLLLPRYRYAVEQSLSRARFLESQNLTILAALVLFLLCVRRHDNSRFVSSMLGVVIRNAQAMGLHRDGSNFQLSPYETEMRRRLWWHICVLDIRASEDHGCDPSIYDQNYDTKFPLDINDEDIGPEDTATPPERSTGSDMTFCLLRFEVSVAIRKLNYPAPIGSQESELSTQQKREMVEAVEKHFYERYINRCDITKPFDWVSAAWARLMLAKMWLAVSNPLQFQDGGVGGGQSRQPASVPLDLRRVAFEKSIEMLELSDLLETGHRAARWRWLFLTHVQWHAVVFVLAYLCIRPNDELSSRAWLVVDKVNERWPSDGRAKKGMLWKPIRRLVERAQQIRAPQNANSLKDDVALERNRSQPHGDRDMSSLGRTRGAQDHPLAFQMEAVSKITEPIVPTEVEVNSIPGSHPRTSTSHLGTMASQAAHRDERHNATANELERSASTAEISGHSTSHFDLSLQSHGVDDFLEAQTVRSDWSNILQELQLGFQEDADSATMDPEDAIQRYSSNLWNIL